MLRNSPRGQRSRVSEEGASCCGKIRPGKLWGRAASSAAEDTGGSRPGAGAVSGVGGPAAGPRCSASGSVFRAVRAQKPAGGRKLFPTEVLIVRRAFAQSRVARQLPFLRAR